jgi:23S rRNA pseudouridine2605 synthase
MIAMTATRSRGRGEVALNRALSKLGLASRAEATRLIRDGRVTVAGTVVRDPLTPVTPERAAIAVDGQAATAADWRALLLHKPRGVVTTRSDPAGRPTVFDVAGAPAAGLVAVGRLDLATSGLLLLTFDTRLAAWITDPANRVPRVYLVTVRGALAEDARARLEAGVAAGGERLAADAVTVRKRSQRETHLVVRLTEGRNREVRRLFAAVGHEVTRLKRVALGGLELGALAPGASRPLGADELRAAFPGAPVATGLRAPGTTAPSTGTRSTRRRTG